MISTRLYRGQGLGNQLWCYAVTRTIAKDRGYEFGIESPELFKGHDFMSLDTGKKPVGILHHYDEKKILHPLNGSDIRIHDTNLVHVSDNTKIDGYMQDENYVSHRKDEIRTWFQVRPEYDCRDYSDDNICIINFRGGGYVFDVDFFLPQRYWNHAIEHMRKINPNFRFIVVTDDIKTAKKFFPDFEVNHWNIGKDYSVIKNAKYLILSNSSFAFFPAWLSVDLKYCIAPKYWGRHTISDGYWSLGYNLTKGWAYLDRKGNLSDYASCLQELEVYTHKNKNVYAAELSNIFKKTISIRIKNNWQIFKAIRKDVSSFYALRWIVYARSLRSAIWIKDLYGRSIKKVRQAIRKILNFFEKSIRHIRWDIQEYRVKKTWLSHDEIKKHRKKIRVYDAFTFFNELDLLEIRLNILDPFVDYFILVEATETFSGHSKPLYFNENKERFVRWKDKIIHVIVDDLPKNEDELKIRLENSGNLNPLDTEIIKNALKSPTVGKQKDGKAISTWLREFYNKECIKRGMVDLSDEDFCYISDVDEIWRPELRIDYSKDAIFKLRQVGYMYYLNNRSNEDEWRGWSGTIATKYKNIRNKCLTDYRGHRIMADKYSFLKNGGWHFSFQGGLEGAKNKIIKYGHFWYNPSETLEKIEGRFNNNQHYRGDIQLNKNEEGLPDFIIKNKDKYKDLLK